MKTFTPEPENKFIEIVRVAVLLSTVGLAIFGGVVITFFAWITGKE